MKSSLLQTEPSLYKNLTGTIQLPSSKSESNRALIINVLTGFKSILRNLSEARDTQTLQRLLADIDAPVWDVLDAGTTMRFLTAYAAVKGLPKELTGTERMCQRPIGILVDALRVLGANIEYKAAEGFPPLQMIDFQYSGKNKIQIAGNVSSQYISALAMVAPLLPEGLTIELTGQIGSWPYIQMTLDLMSHFGIKPIVENQTIQIPAGSYDQNTTFAVESDWSGASYWYSAVAFSQQANILLKGLKVNSLQGDSQIVTFMQELGVQTYFEADGARLIKTHEPTDLAAMTWDFTDCPDLAQTVVVLAAAKGYPISFTGLQSLRIKETDRIKALQQELATFGVKFQETSPSVFALEGKWQAPPHLPLIHTYDDHRMAMAFAPVALRQAIRIEEIGVVAKSYPRFWDDLRSVGFRLSNL